MNRWKNTQPVSGLTRRKFGALGLGAALALVGKGRGEVLPAVSVRQPLQVPHFPSRLHAFVWRNWQLVETGRMAAAVGATPEQIVSTGKAMGLGEPPTISPAVRARSSITVV